jgi:ribosomal-protein-serine acetyltransferase
MRPFLRIDDEISLHLAQPELALPVFRAIDENRAHLRPWLPWVDGTRTVEDTKTFIKESMLHNKDGSRLTTFIYYGEELAGSLGVVNFNKDHRKCEIGYWLREDLQGRGILTKALSVFIEYLFKSKGMNRIEVQVLSGNDRSKGVPLRLGFKQEGALRQSVRMYGSFHDVELFSLLKEEWTHRQEV